MGNQAVSALLQRALAHSDSEPFAPPEAYAGAAGGQLSTPIQREIESGRGSGHALDARTGSQMGQAFGKDFSDVKIHTDAKADLLSRSLNANAFTLGRDIFFRKSAYAPTTSGGKQLLAHELTHVVQQGGGSGPVVQTKLMVGAAHDRYEQEADRVARQVTKRVGSTGAQMPSPQAVIQRENAPLSPVPVRLRANHPGKITRSFNDRAVAFERSLGLYAFHHAKANAAAKAMSDHITSFIEKKGREEGATEKKIDQLWLKSSGRSGETAGSVGEKIDDVKQVFAKGNLRERMTHIYNFMEHHFGNVQNDDISMLEEIAKNPQEVINQFVAFGDRTKQFDNIFYGDVLHKSAPTETALSEQGNMRQRTNESSQTSLTVKDVGLEEEGGLLSEREARLMFGEFDNKDKVKDKQLQWSEGARVWKMKRSHVWVQTMEQIDMPLMAGPSAHTNAFMNIAKLFGLKDLASVRLAAIGHLLPINAHSLVEIMTAAAGHGVPFTPGPEMYRQIPPLTTKELRNSVGKGNFPDEFGSAPTGIGGNYRKLLDKFNAVMKLFAVPPNEADPQRQVTKLTELDQAAVNHIAAKQRQKAKLKSGNLQEAKRLDVRIEAVQEMRDQLKIKMAQAQKTLKLHTSRKRIQELSSNKEYNDKLFHGTHTGLLSGLEKSKGTLISAKELENRGITRSSGEGDFFSNGENRGPKEFISVGLGEFGLGTALAYAQAAGTLPNYNIERYTDQELVVETTRLKEAIDNYDESLIDMRKSEREFKSKAQLQNLYDRLQGEMKARESLDKNHPRRRGELSDDSNFPLLFEFENRGFDVRDEGGYEGREKGMMEAGVYNKEMLGERMIYGGTIDLKPVIRRIYCPLDKIDEVTKKITSIMGHSNFEVLAIEALGELPESTPIGGVRNETYAMQVEFEDVRKDVVSGYAQGMKTKQKINNLRKLAKEYGTVPTKSNKDKPDKPDLDKQVSKIESQPESNLPKPTSQEPVVEVGPPTKVENKPTTLEKQPPLDETPQQRSLRTDGRRRHKIDGNGNCLFAAILHQLGQEGTQYKTPMDLRRALANHMLRTPVHYQQTILAPIFSVEGLTVQQAAVRIQTPGYWSGLVGDTAPQLLASLLERPLILYRPDGSKQTITPMGASNHGPLYLVYNGTDHYDSTARDGTTGPVVSKIIDSSSNIVPKSEETVSPPQSLDKPKESTESTVEPLTGKPQEEQPPSPTLKKEETGESPKPTGEQPKPSEPVKQSVPQPVRNLLKEDSPPVPQPKKGKPRVVLSGHGLLKEKTSPTKTKVPSNMTISFTGPMGSILDNPLANSVEENRLLPEDIFVEAADLETGNVTEIEPHEIIKLYKIFGPRTVKGGKMTPNYTLTPPQSLSVSVNNQVFTVDRDHTLAEIFPILRRIYPKGVDVQWAACQDLPEIDRRFQIKVMNVKDRFVPTGTVKRPTTEGGERKETIKLIAQMIKDFDNI